jgi:hypothetical protein
VLSTLTNQSLSFLLYICFLTVSVPAARYSPKVVRKSRAEWWYSGRNYAKKWKERKGEEKRRSEKREEVKGKEKKRERGKREGKKGREGGDGKQKKMKESRNRRRLE